MLGKIGLQQISSFAVLVEKGYCLRRQRTQWRGAGFTRPAGASELNIFLNKLIEIDQRASTYFASLDNPLLKRALGVVTYLGSGAFWITAYAFSLILFHNSSSKLIFTLIAGEIAGLSTIIVLKYMTKRKRPNVKYKTFFLSPWNEYSFPSHHALRSFLIAVILGVAHPDLLPFLIFMAVTVGFTRLYLLKHYLSDIVIGSFIGIALGMGLQGLLV